MSLGVFCFEYCKLWNYESAVSFGFCISVFGRSLENINSLNPWSVSLWNPGLKENQVASFLCFLVFLLSALPPDFRSSYSSSLLNFFPFASCFFVLPSAFQSTLPSCFTTPVTFAT